MADTSVVKSGTSTGYEFHTQRGQRVERGLLMFLADCIRVVIERRFEIADAELPDIKLRVPVERNIDDDSYRGCRAAR